MVANGTAASNIDVGREFGIVRSILNSFGRLFAFIAVTSSPKGPFTAIAEFCDICHAMNAVKHCAQVTTPEVIFKACPI